MLEPLKKNAAQSKAAGKAEKSRLGVAKPNPPDLFLTDPELQARLRARAAERGFQPDPFLFDEEDILTMARGYLVDRDWDALSAPRTIFEPKPGKAEEDEAPPPAAQITPQRITDLCQKLWDANKNNAAKFAIAVTARLGLKLHGDANAIVAQLQGGGWRRFDDGAKAGAAAANGWLVLAGLKGGDHQPGRTKGHLAVVVKGALNRGRFPTAFWGRSATAASKARTLNRAWNEAELAKVVYAGRKSAGEAAGEEAQPGGQSPGGQTPAAR